MKNILSLFAFGALFITAGCGNKKQKVKANIKQDEIVVKHVVEEEKTAQNSADKKEDYSIAE